MIHEQVFQKFAFWENIPHLLCGLAHFDTAKATMCAEKCLLQWDQHPDVASHHKLSVLFLDPASSPLRSGIERMRAGEPLTAQAQDFQLAVLRFLLVPVVERSIEEKHARIHRQVLRGRRHGGAYVSLNVRMAEIQHRMSQDSSAQKQCSL